MLRVDLLCDGETEPRMRLLAKHVQMFDIDLKLHETLPKNPTERVIVAVGRHAWQVDLPDDRKLVTLHLDERFRDADLASKADYRLSIPAWPARSSDHQVYKLCAYLKSPLDADADTEEDTDTTEPAKPRVSRQQWRNAAALGLLGAVIAGLFFALNRADQPAESDASDVVQQPSSDAEPLTRPERFAPSNTSSAVENTLIALNADVPVPQRLDVMRLHTHQCQLATSRLYAAMSPDMCISCPVRLLPVPALPPGPSLASTPARAWSPAPP